jgi:hypothetical protein
MLDIIKKQVGNTIWEFVCESKSNRSGFCHHVELYKDGDYIPRSVAHVQYYNRTWECYKYQTAMLSCVSTIKERILNKAVEIWKEENGRKRILKAEKNAVHDAAKKSKEYAEMEMLYDLVNNAKYGTEEEGKELEFLDKMLVLVQALCQMKNDVA